MGYCSYPSRSIFEPSSDRSSDRLKKFESILRNPGICLYPPPSVAMLEVQPSSDDIYSVPSLLRFSARPGEMHPELPRPTRTKRIPSSEVRYNKPFSPPMTDDLVDRKHHTPGTLAGRRLVKRFHDGIYIGTITDAWIDDDHAHYWTVTYDDHDLEDLNFVDVTESLALFEIYPTKFRFPGVHPVHPSSSISNDKKIPVPSESPACIDRIVPHDRGDSSSVHSKHRGVVPNPNHVSVDRGVSNKKVSFSVPAEDETFNDCRQPSTPLKSSPPRTRSRTRRSVIGAQSALVGITSFSADGARNGRSSRHVTIVQSPANRLPYDGQPR